MSSGKAGNVSQPFVCLRTARYVSHEGSSPIEYRVAAGCRDPGVVYEEGGEGEMM